MIKKTKIKSKVIIKRSYRFIILLFIILLTSCAYQKQFVTNYKKGTDSLTYESDSQQINIKGDFFVRINNIEFLKDAILDSTVITKNKLPFFYFDYKEFSCQLGKDMIKTDIKQFIEESLHKESLYSGIYQTISQANEFDKNTNVYELDLEIEKLTSVGTFTFAGEQNHTAYPAEATCIINMQLIMSSA